ncbi:terpene synthase family protein [Kitasatospora sp. GAS1066B]|uniref:terpene synthase family protein n=1 Tax=Kitasatospora sp. GAS1066B TaxID=3156271 RepID=UPI003517D4ED
MIETDTRHPGLHRTAHAFLERHELHHDPMSYLDHGYVKLFLAGWRGSTGEPLELAACWGLLVWRLDDVLDTELRDAEPTAVEVLVDRLLDVLDGEPAEPADHPTARALAELVQRTRAAMPEDWWTRYTAELDAWIHAAADKLEGYIRPRRTPTLREYLTLRPIDGGMLLAAMWTELALQCVTPDWNSLPVNSLLSCFSTIGTLTNDLAADTANRQGDTFTAQDALARTTGLTTEQARQRVREQLTAEKARFWFLLTAIRADVRTCDPQDPMPLSPVTLRFALALDHFGQALTNWTLTSSRYRADTIAQPPVPEGPAPGWTLHQPFEPSSAKQDLRQVIAAAAELEQHGVTTAAEQLIRLAGLAMRLVHRIAEDLEQRLGRQSAAALIEEKSR